MQPKGAKGSVTVYASGSPLLLHVAMSAYQTPQKIRPLSSQGFRAAQVPSDKEKREFKVTHMPAGRMPELMAGVGGPRLFSRHPGRTAASSVCAIFDFAPSQCCCRYGPRDE